MTAAQSVEPVMVLRVSHFTAASCHCRESATQRQINSSRKSRISRLRAAIAGGIPFRFAIRNLNLHFASDSFFRSVWPIGRGHFPLARPGKSLTLRLFLVLRAPSAFCASPHRSQSTHDAQIAPRPRPRRIQFFTFALNLRGLIFHANGGDPALLGLLDFDHYTI